MRFYVHDLLLNCPASYYEFLGSGIVKQGQVEIDDQLGESLLARCATGPAIVPEAKRAMQSSARRENTRPGANVAQVARQWPWWAKLVRFRRRQPERGIGDTLERIFGRLGIAWGVKWLGKVTGRVCKCKTRRDGLNISWPYNAV
jgi:hypothetical protein